MLFNNLQYLSSVFHQSYCLHRIDVDTVHTKTGNMSFQEFDEEHFHIRSLDLDTYNWVEFEFGKLYAQELHYQSWYENRYPTYEEKYGLPF